MGSILRQSTVQRRAEVTFRILLKAFWAALLGFAGPVALGFIIAFVCFKLNLISFIIPSFMVLSAVGLILYSILFLKYATEETERFVKRIRGER